MILRIRDETAARDVNTDVPRANGITTMDEINSGEWTKPISTRTRPWIGRVYFF
jgi:hypothetical protein